MARQRPTHHNVIRLAHRPTTSIDPPSHFLPLTQEPIPTLLQSNNNNNINNGVTTASTTINSTSSNNNSDLVLVHRLYLSLDPAMRGWMSSAKSYLPPVPIGEVMRGATLSEVVEVQQNDGGTSVVGGGRRGRLKVGDVVSEFGNDGGWQEYAIVAERSVRKVESLSELLGEQYHNRQPSLPRELPLTVHLSILGTTGLTAYFGFIDICNPLPPSNKSSSTPETVLVTAAAGAVGSIVCQIAKFVYGAKVIGVAGATSKGSWLKDELQCCDEVIDYRAMEKEVEGSKTVGTGDVMELHWAKSRRFQKLLRVALNRVGSKGFDMVFDNVGGYQLNEALCRLNPHARVALCGAISGYNLDMTQQSTSAQSSMTISPSALYMKHGMALISLRAKYRDSLCWITFVNGVKRSNN
eukprot:g6033.t1 g6033   contig20:650980-652209(-)